MLRIKMLLFGLGTAVMALFRPRQVERMLLDHQFLMRCRDLGRVHVLRLALRGECRCLNCRVVRWQRQSEDFNEAQRGQEGQ